MSLDTCTVDTTEWVGADDCTIGDTGCGLLAEQIPSTGTDGPALLYPWLQPGDTGLEVSLRIISAPAGLNLDIFDDGGAVVSTNTPGAYTAFLQGVRDWQLVGTPQPASFTFGASVVSVLVSGVEPNDTVSVALLAGTPANFLAASIAEPNDAVSVNIGVNNPIVANISMTEQNDIVSVTLTNSLPPGYWIEPLTLAEAKAHLRVVVDDDDEYIKSLIIAARQMVEGRTQRTLVPITKTLALPAFCDGVEMPGVPFGGVVSVKYFDKNGVQQTLDPAVYEVYPYAEPARLYLAYDASGYQSIWPTTQPRRAAVLIECTAGYATPADVPAPLKQWMLLAIGAMYENREQVTAVVQIWAIPDSFMGLLWQPYRVYT